MEKIHASKLLAGLVPAGKLTSDPEVALVTTDSREVKPGCIFCGPSPGRAVRRPMISPPVRWSRARSMWWSTIPCLVCRRKRPSFARTATTP